MNSIIYLNGVDISTYVVRYTTNQQMCTGVGTIEMSISGNFPTDIITWDVIHLYEEGSLIGTFNVSSISTDVPQYLHSIEAQDDSKKLIDYFIAEDYEVNYISNNRYWIEKFLEDAGVSYEFQEGLVSALVSENTYMGKTSAYEQITQLLQMSGWYMYFSPTNVCMIGKVDSDLSEPSIIYTDADIVSLKITASDKILRNRAVVWGSANPSNGGWVFANVKRPTPWDYSSDDSRTAVVSNSNIVSISSARDLAGKMLDEWAHLLIIKEVVVVGGRTVNIGDVVYLDSEFYSGACVITTIGSDLSSQGFTTKIILDEKCPRLFGMVNLGSKVYIGTWGEGVKRKPIKYSSYWTPYCSGLGDLHIKDLYVNNGVLSCVTQAGESYISREPTGRWEEVNLVPSGVYNRINGITISGFEDGDVLKARACIQDKLTNNIRLLVDSSGEDNFFSDYTRTEFVGGKAWVFNLTPQNKLVGAPRISFADTDLGTVVISGITGIDIENDGTNDYLSVIEVGEFTEIEEVNSQVPYAITLQEVVDYLGGSPHLGWSGNVILTVESLGAAGFYIINGSPTISEVYQSTLTYSEAEEATLRTQYTEECTVAAVVVEVFEGTYEITTPSFIINFIPEETGAESQQYRITVSASIDAPQENKGDFSLQSVYHPPGGYMVTRDWEVWVDSHYYTYDITTSGTGALVEIGGDSTQKAVILKRDGDDFTVVHAVSHVIGDIAPIRLDISNYLPLVTFRSTENSLSIIDNGSPGTTVHAYDDADISSIGDFRYTYLTSGTYKGNGQVSGRTLLVTIAGELMSADISDFVTLPTFSTVEFPSGILLSGWTLDALETSNYFSDAQYIFVATSGYNPKFYQRDWAPFRDQSVLLGDAPVTIIRLDDRL